MLRKASRTIVSLFALAFAALAPVAVAQPVYEFTTLFGSFDVELFPEIAPATVANFQSYLNSGAYDQTFLHRSVPGFVLQGGGFTLESDGRVYSIATGPPVANEFQLSNTRGTISMAKLGGDPNSATSQWFFNLVDNSANLDFANGGYTVFGRVTDAAGLAVLDQIAALPRVNAGGAFNELPVYNYSGSGPIYGENLVVISSIVPEPGSVLLLALGGALVLSRRA